VCAACFAGSYSTRWTSPSKCTSLPPPESSASPRAIRLLPPRNRRPCGTAEAVVEEVDAAEVGEEAERGGDQAGDGVVVEAEATEARQLADAALGERALPGERDGDDALDPRPGAGAGGEAGAVPGAEEAVGVGQVVLDGLQALVVRL
jgi:hypothetical protein